MSEIDDWFNQYYWTSYPADLCGSSAKKGSKAKALDIIKKKIKPDSALRSLMAKNLSDQVIQARKDNEPDRWPHMTTYLNEKRFLDAVEQAIEGGQSVEVCICTHEGCKNATHGPNYQKCTYHLPAPPSPVLELMRQAYRNRGYTRREGETREEHVKRLRESTKAKIKGLISMPDHIK